MKLQVGGGVFIPQQAVVFTGANTPPVVEVPIPPDHANLMGELTFAIDGVMVVSSPEGHWVVPPSRVLWLAPKVKAKIRTLGRVRTCSVTLDAGASGLPLQSCVVALSPLLRELLYALDGPLSQTCPSSHHALLVTEQLKAAINKPCTQPLSLPSPKEPRVGRICTHIQDNLEDNKSLQDWSVDLELHCRTLHRLFLKEVGMSFVQWRQQAKLLKAMEWLAEGRQILSVALDLGYQTQSAFTVMFRRNLGITPGQFIKSMSPHS